MFSPQWEKVRGYLKAKSSWENISVFPWILLRVLYLYPGNTDAPMHVLLKMWPSVQSVGPEHGTCIVLQIHVGFSASVYLGHFLSVTYDKDIIPLVMTQSSTYLEST